MKKLFFQFFTKHWFKKSEAYAYKKKLYGPFLWMGFNCLKATATSRRQFTVDLTKFWLIKNLFFW